MAAAKLSTFDKAVQGNYPSLQIGADVALAEAKLAALGLQSDALQKKLGDLKIGGTSVSTLISAASQAGIDAAISKMGTLTDTERDAATAAYGLSQVIEGMAQKAQELSSLSEKGMDFTVDPAALDEISTLYKHFVEAKSAAGTLGNALASTNSEIDATGDTAKRAAAGWLSLNGAVSNLGNISIPLFATSMKYAEDAGVSFDNGIASLGHSFLTVGSGLHLVIESAVELTAVWGPALLALTLFGAAAIPTVKDIGTQLLNMNDVTTATGAKFKDLTTDSNGLVASLRPEVMQLFGDALIVASSGSGELEKSLLSVGHVLDGFGADIAQAFQSSTGSKFLSSAAKDVDGLGVAFVQVGRIISTLLQAVPGYAAMLLKVGDAALTVGADAVQGLEPAIAVFLKLHGAVFYLGLASTLVGTFGKSAVQAFTQVATGGEKLDDASNKLSGLGQALGNASGGLVALGQSAVDHVSAFNEVTEGFSLSDKAAVGFSLAMDAIPFGPWGVAAGLLAAAVGGVLYFALKSTNSEVVTFNANMQKMIASSNIVDVQQNIASATEQTSAQIQKYADQVANLNTQYKATANSGSANASNLHANIGLQQQATQAQAQLNRQIQQYAGENATAAIRLNDLGKSYGDTTGVMQLMNLAGVKQGDVATANASAWAKDLIQIEATAKAYGLMGTQAGQTGNQLDTLTISTGNTTKAVQTLTSAENAWLTLITSGDSAFAAFEQGQQTLTDALNGKVTPAVTTSTTATTKAGKSLTKLAKGGTDVTNSLSNTASTTKSAASSADTLSVSVGKITEKFSLAGAQMNGTSVASLAARQAFDSQITSAGTLYGNLQQLAAASGNNTTAEKELASAGKDLVAQLLPMAAGSKTATAEVYALAQVAGYTGPDSFKSLAQWVGNTKSAESNLNGVTQDLTVSSADLSTAAKNLGTVLGSDVTSSQAAAILSTSKFTTAQTDLIAATEASKGKLSDTAITAAGAYYESMLKAGLSTQDATQYVDALLQKLGDTPAQIAKVNASLKTLPSQVNVNINETLTGSGAIKAQVSANAVSIASVNQGNPGTQTAVLNNAAKIAGLTDAKAAGGMVVRGSGASGQDSQHILAAPGELIIPTTHAAAHMEQAKREGIPMATGGIVGGAVPAASAGINAAASGIESMTSQAMTQFASQLNNAAQAAAGAFTGVASASGMANELTIAKYLLANGLTRAAAAGVAATIYGESAGNPESVGSGGFGLIGWTGNSIGLPAGYDNPTGNLQHDLGVQLRGVIGYIEANGGIGPLNKEGSAVAAGDLFSADYERPAVRYSDTRPSLANLLYAELGSGSNTTKAVATTAAKPHSAGGMITEPVAGIGLNSGSTYSFGESGPEQVIPGGTSSVGQQQQPMTQTQGMNLLNMTQQMVKLLQQAPVAQAHATTRGMSAGANHGQYAAGR